MIYRPRTEAVIVHDSEGDFLDLEALHKAHTERGKERIGFHFVNRP